MQRKDKKIYEFNQSPFYCLQSKKKLAKLLFITYKKLQYLTSSQNLYLTGNRVCSNGKLRHLEKPIKTLKIIQKRIKNLLDRIKIPNYIFNLSKGKSHIDNGRLHFSNSVMMRLDIKKYFPSTSSKRVYRFFRNRMKCSPDVAGILVSLLTYKGHLPTGSPHSPILSYFANIEMWESIDKIMADTNCTISVWVDDITISGDKIPENTKLSIKQAIKSNGFKYHKEKHYKEEDAKEVTGIIISNNQLKSPNRHHLKKYTLKNSIQKQTDSKQKYLLSRKLQGLEAHMKRVV